jgi:cell division protein FtsW
MVEFKGSEINNATRWLKIGPLTIQPSEFFKIIIPMLFAFSLDKQGKIIVKNRNGLNWKVIFNFFIIALGTFLIFIEPDFGTTILILTILFIGLFISRTRFKYIILMFAIIVSLLFLATITSNYRLNRFRAILSPTKGEQTIRYQIIQSQKAIRTGGILGKGLGKSNQKIFYLPEAWSDFIFAVISEEIGGIGTLLLLLLYFLLYWNIYKIGITCKDMRLRYFVILFFILCSIQTCLNIGVAIGALPPTGTVLPLISQGGSSFTAFMIGFGICESVRLKDG